MPAEQVVDLLGLAGRETVIDYGAGPGRLLLAPEGLLTPGVEG